MIPSPPLLPLARLLKAGTLWRSSTAATEKTPAAGCVPDIRTNYSKAATPIWTKNFLNWTASFARRLFRANRPAYTLEGWLVFKRSVVHFVPEDEESMKPPSNVKTPAQYIASLPADRAKTIATVRAFVNKHIPRGYDECLVWGT